MDNGGGEHGDLADYACRDEDEGLGLCTWILTLLSLVVVAATFPLSLFFCLKIVQE